MRICSLLLFIVMVAAPSDAQPPKAETSGAPEVRLTIKVIDSSTGAGVPGATIYISGAEDSDTLADAPDSDAMGLSGTMVPEKSSWEIVAGTAGFSVAHSVVHVGHEALTVTVALARAAGIFGRVIDADTKLPVAEAPVQVWQLSWVRGRPQIGAASRVISTDVQGRFETKNLPAGDYIVETYAPPRDAAPGPRYSRQVWPGGRDFADAVPLSVVSGADFDFGTIAIVRRTLATVSFRVVGECAGRRYDVRLIQTYANGGVDRAQAQSVACGKTSSFAQVPPGSYGLVATPADAQAAGQSETGEAWIEVADSDMAVDLTLRGTPLTTLRGRVVTENGDDAQGVAGVSVTFLSGADVRGLVAGMPLASESATGNAAGSFEQRLYVPPGGKVAVKLSGLPSGLYVEALRYNGVRLPSDQFVLNGFAITQELDIICSDKFGVVSGAVAGDSGLVDFLLVPWPNDGTVYPSGMLEAQGDPDGKFGFSPVRPGHYKAVAVRADERAKFEAPFRLMSALPNAPDVDVVSGSGNSIRIGKPVE
jgi:hypothetical protein